MEDIKLLEIVLLKFGTAGGDIKIGVIVGICAWLVPDTDLTDEVTEELSEL